MKIIIIGGGETGFTLASLLEEECEITIIESDEKLAKQIANKTSAMVLHGEGADVSILKEAGIESSDAIVVTTKDDKTNLMICEIAKSEKVKKIISLVNSPKNEELFTKLSINKLVSVVGTNVTEIRKIIYQYGEERIIAQLGGGKLQIIEQTVSKESSLIGKEPKIDDGTVAAIYRGGEFSIPNEKMKLKEGDVLLVVVMTKDLPKVSNLISGK